MKPDYYQCPSCRLYFSKSRVKRLELIEHKREIQFSRLRECWKAKEIREAKEIQEVKEKEQQEIMRRTAIPAIIPVYATISLQQPQVQQQQQQLPPQEEAKQQQEQEQEQQQQQQQIIPAIIQQYTLPSSQEDREVKEEGNGEEEEEYYDMKLSNWLSTPKLYPLDKLFVSPSSGSSSPSIATVHTSITERISNGALQSSRVLSYGSRSSSISSSMDTSSSSSSSSLIESFFQ